MATRDALSGCLNRRAFHEQLAPLFARSQKQALPLSCLMIDIDNFKAVNDTHGHATGDRVIQEVAKQIAAAARAEDLVCRYGGEEFLPRGCGPRRRRDSRAGRADSLARRARLPAPRCTTCRS